MASSPVSRAAEPIPGYVLRDRIGAGGYGEVWSCEAPGGLIKAIKFIYGFHDEDRASRELKALNRVKGVRHPFLLSLERIEIIGGQLVIVTELADASLKDIFDRYVKEGKPGIPRAELLGYLHDTADALDYMNEHHTLQHLDVKPENLLVVGGRIKVADFGLVKDLHESQCSLMGGLTPLYAPPEVFDARPSRRSDQYSLAIVYQEMLTGLLPFPGKTAAQLAAQHLNARPLLSTLPTGDQPVVAKALSKDPQGRFTNCREMVAGLMAAVPAARGNGQGPTSGSAASSESHQGQHTEVRNPSAMLQLADSAISAADNEECYAVQPHFGPEAFVDSPVAPLIDGPPQTVDPSMVRPAPTLFVGIGGIASRACQQLKRQLQDVFGEGHPALAELLVFDTDCREVQAATIGEYGAPLLDEQVLAIPLRKPQDYRDDSRSLLSWLGRRWLYNIPRSQQTEGMRPLGRLAFVDHSETIFERLRSSLERLSHRYRESLVNSVGANPKPLRVVVVGSTSGGTAGGIALDMVYACRQLLDELAPRGHVDLLLAHAASRSPAAKELANANTLATLTEARQMLAPGGTFPGDPAAGLEPRNNQVSPVNDFTLIPLGDELSADDVTRVAGVLAELIFEKNYSVVSPLLTEAFSRSEDSIVRSSGGTTTIRTLGMARLGFAQDDLLHEVSTRLAHQVVELWSGEPVVEPPASGSRSLASVSPAASAAFLDAQIDERTQKEVEKLGLQIDALIQLVSEEATQQLAGNPAEMFAHLRDTAGKCVPGQIPPLDRWVAASLTLFGPRPYDEVPPTRNSSPLRSNLFDHVKDLAEPIGNATIAWLLGDAEVANGRVYAALRSCKWIQNHLKGMIEALRDKRKALAAEQQTCEGNLVALSRTEPSKWSRQKPPLPEPTAAFTQYCQIRLLDLCTEVAGQLVRAIQSHATMAGDQLLDMARDVKFLKSELGPIPSVTDTASKATEQKEPGLAAIRQKVRAQLLPALAEASFQMDRKLSQSHLQPYGGLRKVLSQGGQNRLELISAIRSHARQIVLEQLSKTDLLSLAITTHTATGETLFARLLQDAQPFLAKVGGLRRTYALLPEKASQALTAVELSQALGKMPISLLPSRNNEVVFLVDVRVASLAKAAASLMEGRADLAEAAKRLHTRADIEWQPL